jgi:hypothetical protein
MTTDRRYGPTPVLTAVAILLLPLAYVFSVGPAVWLSDHGYLNEWTAVIYAPVEYLYEHSKSATDVLDWYIELRQ